MPWKWIMAGATLLGPLLLWIFLSSLFGFHLILVLDDQSLRPVGGANVETWRHNGFNGCSSISREYIGGLGLIFTRGTGPLNRLCNISVKKEEYHPNGKGNEKISGAGIDLIRIRRMEHPERLIYKVLEFQKGDKADLLTPLLEDSRKIRRIPANAHPAGEIDFDLPADGTAASIPRAIGASGVRIRFFGEGGIVQVPAAIGVGHDLYWNYALENVIEAPKEGYSKELFLERGGVYVARLRDGKHYLKFTVSLSALPGGGPSLKLDLYLQPRPSPRLETRDATRMMLADPRTNEVQTAGSGEPRKTAPLQILSPKEGEHYDYSIEPLFSGTASAHIPVNLTVEEYPLRWVVYTDGEGRWATSLPDADQWGVWKEKGEKHVTVSTATESARVGYTVGPRGSGLRSVDLGLFRLTLPSHLATNRISRPPREGWEPDRITVNILDTEHQERRYLLFAWRASEIDLEMRAGESFENARTYYPLELEKIEIGKLKGYKVRGSGRYPGALFLFYRGVLLETPIPAGNQLPEEWVEILNTFEPEAEPAR